jgi:hypothetical protein
MNQDPDSDVSISSTGSVTKPLKKISDVEEIGSAAKKKKMRSPMQAIACTPTTKKETPVSVPLELFGKFTEKNMEAFYAKIDRKFEDFISKKVVTDEKVEENKDDVDGKEAEFHEGL